VPNRGDKNHAISFGPSQQGLLGQKMLVADPVGTCCCGFFGIEFGLRVTIGRLYKSASRCLTQVFPVLGVPTMMIFNGKI
jgi:hypothetical protein